MDGVFRFNLMPFIGFKLCVISIANLYSYTSFGYIYLDFEIKEN